MQHDQILILDFGTPQAQLIARRIRDLRVYCRIHSGRVPAADLAAHLQTPGLKGLILCTPPEILADAAAMENIRAICAHGLPVLGIGSMAVVALALGGAADDADQPGATQTTVRARGHSRLLQGIEDRQGPNGEGLLAARILPGFGVVRVPPDGTVIATGQDERVLGIAAESRALYALQLDLATSQTPQAPAILQRFVCDICQARQGWTMAAYAQQAVEQIRSTVGTSGVLLGLSGGVDSSVAAALIHRAIGSQLTCVLVDHGLMRLNEARNVLKSIRDELHVQVIHVDAAQRFLSALEGLSDPERKRKTIGHVFVEVFIEEAQKLQASNPAGAPIAFLAQGTIYPDVIESGKGSGAGGVVKSHHNVGGLPEQLGLDLLEPLRELFKDEVRQLGLALGLKPAMVFRHPFPGPGLGVRILGEIKPGYPDMLRQADAIFMEELRATVDPASGRNWYELTSQAFVVFLPVRSVGAVDGQRNYEYAVALRAVQTTDFMTAECAELPHALLRRVSQRIIREVDGINRVTFDISSKPPATIEWE